MRPKLNLINQRFGRLTVLEEAGYKGRAVTWRCICDCGNECIAIGHTLKSGDVQSCGCLARETSLTNLARIPKQSPSNKMHLTGQTFGRLTAIEEIGRGKNWQVLWRCQCICGNETIVPAGKLRQGSTTSCGCRLLEIRDKRTHGLSDSTTYRSWDAARQRCENPHNVGYPFYGAEGVRFAERWRSFTNFLTDMGERPSGTTLGRFGDVGNYEPGNCQWMTRPEQEAERRKHRRSLFED